MLRKEKEAVIMFMWVCLSAIIQSFVLVSFSMPVNIYPSGVTGFSRIVSDILGDFFNIDLPFFYLYLIINVLLAILVYRHIGKMFTVFSLLQTVLVSIMTSVFKPLHMLDDTMLIAIFGGLINGFGVGLALTHDASSGGLDFLSIYFSNKFHRSMWDYVLGFNCLLIVATGMIYGWERAAYSIIFQFVSNYVVSHMHKRYTHEAIIIVTKHPDAVIDSILKNVRHGITRLEAKGAYKGEDVTMLYTVVNSFQTAEVVKYALMGDEKAFIETRKTTNIYGNYYQKPLN